MSAIGSGGKKKRSGVDDDAKTMKTSEFARVAMQAVVPTLRITNYERGKTFYVDGLGFTVEWEHRFQPSFPVFMSIVRDGMTLFLTEHTGDCLPGGLVHFYIADVDAWYDEFRAKRIPVDEPPNDELPGVRMMTVVDPDGNKLRFCTRRPDWSR